MGIRACHVLRQRAKLLALNVVICACPTLMHLSSVFSICWQCHQWQGLHTLAALKFMPDIAGACVGACMEQHTFVAVCRKDAHISCVTRYNIQPCLFCGAMSQQSSPCCSVIRCLGSVVNLPVTCTRLYQCGVDPHMYRQMLIDLAHACPWLEQLKVV